MQLQLESKEGTKKGPPAWVGDAALVVGLIVVGVALAVFAVIAGLWALTG